MIINHFINVCSALHADPRFRPDTRDHPIKYPHIIFDGYIDLKLLIEDSNACTGEFIIYSVLELFLRRQTSPANVIFVGAMQSFSHYSAVLKKLVGINCVFMRIGVKPTESC